MSMRYIVGDIPGHSSENPPQTKTHTPKLKRGRGSFHIKTQTLLI